MWPPRARGPYAPLPNDDPVTRDILATQGRDPDQLGPHPLPGSPTYLEPDMLIRWAAPRIAEGLFSWLERHDQTPAASYVCHISTALTERLWFFLEGSRWFPRWELQPDAALWASLLRSHRWVALGDDEARILRFWYSARAHIIETGEKYLDPATLDRFAADAGLELLRTVGASTSLPLGLDLPVIRPGDVDDGWIVDETVEGARARLIDLRRAEGLDTRDS